MSEALSQPPRGTTLAPLLEVRGVTAGYGILRAINEIDISLGAGEAVGIIGHNGAGKTTLLRAIFGNIKAFSGTVSFAGESRAFSECSDSIKRGMAFVPADRYTFASLTVRENLQIARLNARTNEIADAAAAAAEELFPIVGQRLEQIAATLSGGERRMLGIAMSLMWEPKLLLLDEPSLGLAPATAERVFNALKHLVETKNVSILCVEQSVPQLLALVNRVYVIRSGRVIREMSAAALAAQDDLWSFF
jgi:branched-chain amino acid transport system ATP-binding protein